MSKTTVTDVLARLQVLFEVESDSALANVMGVNRQTLGSWRARGKVPYEECVNLAAERGLSLDWLFMGDGQMQRGAAVEMTAKNPRESAVLRLMRQLPDDDQWEVQLIAQGKKRLHDIEQQLEQVTSALASLRVA